MTDEYFGENQPAQRTTPTWELELLISGATVFGLMQLPDPLNRWLVILMNGNEQQIVELVRTVSIYLQFSLITLILTFVLHLLARGYWVAMVGMYSVYPQGIRWDKSATGGPVYREAGERQMGSMSERIEQADNRATKIFGIGFGMAMAMMAASIIVGLMIIVLMVVQMLGGDLDKWNTGLWILLGALFLPFFIAYLIDAQFGEKLKASGNDGWIRLIYWQYRKIGMGNGTNPLLTLYTSNEGAQKTAIGMAVVMIPLMLGIAVFTSTRGTAIDNGAYDALPKPELGSQWVMRQEYYASSRGDEFSTTLVPYIEDAVVASNYVRLFVPYQPSRYNEFLEKQCPASLARKAANDGDGLNCLSKYFAIQVDGKATTQNLMAATDAKTGQRGVVAMIDVRNLPDGQHLIKIKAVPKASEEAKKAAPKFHLIPFWK